MKISISSNSWLPSLFHLVGILKRILARVRKVMKGNFGAYHFTFRFQYDGPGKTFSCPHALYWISVIEAGLA